MISKMHKGHNVDSEKWRWRNVETQNERCHCHSSEALMKQKCRCATLTTAPLRCWSAGVLRQGGVEEPAEALLNK